MDFRFYVPCHATEYVPLLSISHSFSLSPSPLPPQPLLLIPPQKRPRDSPFKVLTNLSRRLYSLPSQSELATPLRISRNRLRKIRINLRGGRPRIRRLIRTRDPHQRRAIARRLAPQRIQIREHEATEADVVELRLLGDEGIERGGNVGLEGAVDEGDDAL